MRLQMWWYTVVAVTRAVLGKAGNDPHHQQVEVKQMTRKTQLGTSAKTSCDLDEKDDDNLLLGSRGLHHSPYYLLPTYFY